MEQGKFNRLAMSPGNPKWEKAIARFGEIYQKEGDIRSEFSRDYNRILHCKAYRRLKHKTQVFYATSNDHICTRMEHVNHVAAVSYSIANFLGLNTELTGAIAIGHDLGHTPFGHQGEHVLRTLLTQAHGADFWHEMNSLHFVDKLETLPSLQGKEHNLCLTYAVRDGIISHCGEVNENAIKPREEVIDLYNIEHANQYAPFSWEACVVKIADKISYLGRDIEDALSLGILTRKQLDELGGIVEKIRKIEVSQINNTLLMHDFINNLCDKSNPNDGIRFSPEYLELINEVKAFNYRNIYLHPRMKYYNQYAELIISSIFEVLLPLTREGISLEQELNAIEQSYPSLGGAFKYWLIKYSDFHLKERAGTKFGNTVIYAIHKEKDMVQAVADYISSMTDQFAIKLFGELTRF